MSAYKPLPSPTAGMTTAQRILHVGGRTNAAGYIEFGSVQAVAALLFQFARDQPKVDLEALGKEINAEHERALNQQNLFLKTGVSTAAHGGSHDTCFNHILRKHLDAHT